MHQNVGPNERLIRLAIGTVAGGAGMTVPQGWQRAALCSVATAGLVTGLTRYCPLNAALGISRAEAGHFISEHEQGVRDTEIRRETQTSAAMGRLPGMAVDAPAPTGITP